MADYGHDTKSSDSVSCTSNSYESAVAVTRPCSVLNQERPQNLSVNHHSELEAPSKPELNFSIERILGLGTRSTTRNISHSLLPREKLTSGHYYASADPVFPEDDEDDNDDDDDDEDDNESIDVDDPTLMENSERNIFMAAYPNFAVNGETPKYQWLQCTRYHPPKIQRSKKKEGTKRRKLGRNPRVPFTQHQVSVLEDKFRRTHYLSSMDVAELSSALNLTETRVKIWFQNRRARERRDKEATQRNQVVMVTKSSSFQPLTIPSVAWPISASLAPAATYAQFQAAIDYRQSYLTSGYNFFNNVRDTHAIRAQSAASYHQDNKRPTTTSESTAAANANNNNNNNTRQLVKF